MRVFLIGAGSQAMICQRILAAQGHEVTHTFDQKAQPSWPGELISREDEIPSAAEKCDGFLVCIADGKNGERRVRLSTMLMGLGLKPMSAIHGTSFISGSAKIGIGAQVLAHSAVSEDAQIGNWCILNTNCSVDHECRIGHGVHIMGAAALAGEVTVGDNTAIGTNATILPKIRIGSNCYIGAGAVVTKDVPDNSVMVGNPARLLRRNQP